MQGWEVFENSYVFHFQDIRLLIYSLQGDGVKSSYAEDLESQRGNGHC